MAWVPWRTSPRCWILRILATTLALSACVSAPQDSSSPLDSRRPSPSSSTKPEESAQEQSPEVSSEADPFYVKDRAAEHSGSSETPFSPEQRKPWTNAVFAQKIDPAKDQGQYFHLELPGKASGLSLDLMVWLPKGYLSHPDESYPVILAFSGYPGVNEQLKSLLQIGERVSAAAQAGKVRQSIVISPNVYPGDFDSECVDSARGKMETFITKDVVQWATKNLRTAKDHESWATFGFSAGGFCSSMLAYRHPDLFASSINASGYFDIDYTDKQIWYPESDPTYQLSIQAKKSPAPVRIFFITAADDKMPMDSLRRFRPEVRIPTTLDVEILPNGGHSAGVWRIGVDHGLQWLGEHSPGFAAI